MIKESRTMEKIGLVIFMVYHGFMILGSIGMEMPSWVAPLIIIIAASSIVVFVGRFKEYEFRTRVYTIGILVNFFVFSLYNDVLQVILVPFVFIIIVIGMFGIKELLIYPVIFALAIIFVQYFVLERIHVYSIHELYTVINPLANVFITIIVIAFWVHSRDKKERQIQSIISDLKEAEKSKDDFLANVSHEVRTPINSIKGISEIILREDISTELRHNIERIQLSGNNLLRIVDDLLDFTEVLSGNFDIENDIYYIDSLLNDVVNISSALKEKKNIEILFNCDPSFPRELIGDVQKIKRVIVNLLSNAIKFTNEGGVIISFDYRVEDYGINLCISFRDTGIGIEKKSMETIFTSFSQVDTKRNRTEGGVGMGLALSKAITEKMGGFINVVSEPGVGSEFRAVIPQRINSEKKLINPSVLHRGYVLIYIDMEQFRIAEIRDEYIKLIQKLSRSLDMPVYLCRNLAEFKRREALNHFKYFFISWVEYCYDRDYFNRLADEKNLSIFLDFNQEYSVDNNNINVIFKPVNLLNVISVFGENLVVKRRDYIAPEASVLIVDDNEVNLKVAQGLMKGYQCKIDAVTSGLEALKRLENQQYDIVFMDHMMPEMDGVETLHRLREKSGSYFRDIPVIALSANAVPGARDMFLREGFQEFVAKPVDSEHLADVLMNYLPAEKIQVLENTEIDEEALAEIDKESEALLSDQNNTDYQKVIDIREAIAYCGSVEAVNDILKLHYEDGEANIKKIESAYETEDWKNYTIMVHGLKSSMRSVGINTLADMAFELENAGKNLDIDIIKEKHNALLEEYRRILGIIAVRLDLNTGTENNRETLPQIEADKLMELYDAFEKAVYTFEDKEIKAVLNDIFMYSVGGGNLCESLEKVGEAVQECDYMSALAYFNDFMDKLSEG